MIYHQASTAAALILLIAHSVLANPLIRVETYAGKNGTNSGVDGFRTNTSFPRPIGMTQRGGHRYIVASHRVRRVNATGHVETMLRKVGQSEDDESVFWGARPVKGAKSVIVPVTDIVSAGADGMFFVSWRESTVYWLDDEGLGVYAGTANKTGNQDGDVSEATFNNPTGIAVDSDFNILIADRNNSAIRKIDLEGQVSTMHKLSIKPFSITLDKNDTIYVAGGNKILKINGTKIKTLHKGRKSSFHGIAVHENGNVYFTDSAKNRIMKYNAKTGKVSVFAGIQKAGFLDGEAKLAQFNRPLRLHFSKNFKILFILDTDNNLVRMIRQPEIF